MSHLRTILPYFEPYRRGVLIGLFLVVVANVFTIAAPYLLKLAIDGFDDPEVTRSSVIVYAILIVAAAVLGGAARYGMRELLNGISRRIECDLRADFFRHLMRLDASFYNKNRTGDIMSRATNDTLAVRMATGPAIMYSVNTTVVFSFALALMIWISPRLTLLALIPMAILPPVVFGFGRIIHRRFEQIQEQFSTLSTMVQENLTGVRIVRAYVQGGAQAAEFDQLNREYMARNMSLVRAVGLFHPTLGLLTGGAIVIVLWLGGLEVVAGRITVGEFVAFGIYLNLLTWPMIALGWVVNLFQRGAASMARLNKIFSTEPAVRAPATVAPISAPRGEIEFRNVSFRYPGTERFVLQDVSFIARPGDTIAVVGPTGSGKSTLLSLVPRIYDATAGEVLMDGRRLTDYDPEELRRHVGTVPQDPFLFSETMATNIGLGLDARGPAMTAFEEDSPWPAGDGAGAFPGPGGDGSIVGWEGEVDSDPDPVVVRAAKIAQLHESIEAFPGQYATRIGERGINLSGGQKQRATLARAVARNPVVLILDDALSAVDTHTESQILEDLKDVMRGRTSFVISHRLSAVMRADQILVLEDGRVVERGTHAELAGRRGGVYARLLRRQMLEQDLESDLVGSGAD